MPKATAALPTWNQGKTVPSMTLKPSPSAESRWPAVTTTLSRVMGALALPRRPSPFQTPAVAKPAAWAGTKYRLLARASDRPAAPQDTT
jgi:hypothetical protein